MRKLIYPILLAMHAACSPRSPQNVSVNDVTLNYVVKGDGPPLYLLHGGMESRDSFEKQITEFSKHFTVVALDSREQGRSGKADAQISYELMSKDVVSLSQHLGHDRISIMGLSDGGVTALTTAITNPKIIDKLILLGANYHYDSYPAETREFLANYKWDGNTDPKSYPGNFIKHYMTGHNDLSDFGNLLEEMSAMWTQNPTFTVSDIAKVKSKTLVIAGDHEDMDLGHTLSLYNALPNAQLFIVPDATHYSLQEKPALINGVAIQFLKEH